MRNFFPLPLFRDPPEQNSLSSFSTSCSLFNERLSRDQHVLLYRAIVLQQQQESNRKQQHSLVHHEKKLPLVLNKQMIERERGSERSSIVASHGRVLRSEILVTDCILFKLSLCNNNNTRKISVFIFSCLLLAVGW